MLYRNWSFLKLKRSSTFIMGNGCTNLTEDDYDYYNSQRSRSRTSDNRRDSYSRRSRSRMSDDRRERYYRRHRTPKYLPVKTGYKQQPMVVERIVVPTGMRYPGPRMATSIAPILPQARYPGFYDGPGYLDDGMIRGRYSYNTYLTWSYVDIRFAVTRFVVHLKVVCVILSPDHCQNIDMSIILPFRIVVKKNIYLYF